MEKEEQGTGHSFCMMPHHLAGLRDVMDSDWQER